jgi:pentatricopeptide repeat protein
MKSCGTSGALGNGQEIHAEITKKGLGGHSLSVENSLITMYANCGLIAEAQYVFNNLEVTDVISWTAIMKGYAVNHKGEMAVACFEEMQEQGIVQADDITLTCLLTACSHACLVMDGIQYLKIMREKYGIIVKEQHYSCIIDLLGRSGNLYEAERTLEALCPSSGASWAALLSACKAYGDVELGLRCFRELSILEPDNAAWYVLMKDVYANANRQDDALTVEMLRVQTRTVRKPARASIEVNNVLHEFCASEIRTEALSSMMQSLNSKLKHEGHLANVEAILKPVNDEEKEVAVCEHAERIAIAFGLLHTPQGHTLHVTKNLRMCNDCHTAGKTISRVTRREIILRDESCVHHFKDGLCLCNDMF